MHLGRTISLLLLLALVLPLRADEPSGPPRGKKFGKYNLKLVGDYKGDGVSNVFQWSTISKVTITLTIRYPDGSTCDATFTDMHMTNDRFQGSTAYMGTTLSITGRMDMPKGTDPDLTPNQKFTGRISALVTDTSGKASRLVAVQDPASRMAE